MDLGASPNYRDPKGLTPLYHLVSSKDSDPALVEMLLRDYAVLGVRDEGGWTELHQVCVIIHLGDMIQLISLGYDTTKYHVSDTISLF